MIECLNDCGAAYFYGLLEETHWNYWKKNILYSFKAVNTSKKYVKDMKLFCLNKLIDEYILRITLRVIVSLKLEKRSDILNFDSY